MSKFISCLIALSLLLLAVVPAQAAVQYTVKPLGNFWPMAINKYGDVVGNISTSTYSIAVFYNNSDETLIELGSFGGLGSYASDINDNGQIVGNYMLSDGTYHAFSYINGIMTDLGNLGGLGSFADGINNNGQIVGCINTSGNDYSAFLLSDGNLIELGNLGGSRVFAEDINNNGQITGNSSMQDGPGHAFIYENNSMTDIGTLGGYSMASAINDIGQIVGHSIISSGIAHAFLFDDGIMKDISPSEITCVAYDINSCGQIVGNSTSIHAFLYENGETYDLNQMIDSNLEIQFNGAICINDNGQIVAKNTDSDVFLLTPIPEPSNIILIVSFFIPFITILWRKRK